MTIPATTITMDSARLLRLSTWFSAAFPIGGFAWSSGLEQACRSGEVTNAADLRRWIETALSAGWMRNDAILLAAAHRGEDVQKVNDLALALSGSSQRFAETSEQGEAFVRASRPWSSTALPSSIALPVAAGHLCRENGLPVASVLVAFLQAAVSQQVQAALRLMPLGQSAAMALTAELEPSIIQCADAAQKGSLDDLGSHALVIDIAAMCHETLPSRIFRS